MKNCFLYLMLFFVIGIVNAQDLRLRKGTITDSIVIPNSNNEMYALYLPKTFSMDRNWPIVFVFDPMAQGKRAINQFYQAAEKYEYVVVASNATRNGPYNDNFIRAKNLINTFISNFPVDKQRMYLAGFSGGARLAMAIASSSDNFKGVIACGAGFPSSTFIPSENTFAYIGIAGDEDFNYKEVKDVVAILKIRKYDAEFLPFNGQHTWAPSIQIEKAIRLLTLKAMNKGYVSNNENLIHEFYLTDYNYNSSLLNQGKYNWAYNDLRNLIKNYRFHVDSDSLNIKLKSLRKTDKYKIQNKNALEVDVFEKEIWIEYLSFLNSDIEAADMQQIGMWANEMNSLERYAKKMNGEGEKMYKRLKNSLFVYVKGAVENYNEKENLDNLLYINALITILEPNYFDPYLKTIQYAVKKSEYGMALFYLEELLKNGFKDSQKLIDLDGISLLRISPEYNELLEKYGLKSMY